MAVALRHGYVCLDGAEALRSLATHEVQTSIKFENSLSCLWGEGGQRPGEGEQPTEPPPLVVRGRSLMID